MAGEPTTANPAPPAGEAPDPRPSPPDPQVHRRGAGRGDKVRPWWGMGDVLLMIPIMALVFLLSFVVWAVLAALEGIDFADIGSTSSSDLPASIIVIPTFIQQAAWFGWPFIVSKWKGLGTAADWGLAFKPIDLAIGVGVAMIAMFAAGLAAAGATAAVGLEDESLAENTQLLTDHQNSAWLYPLLMLIVSGAPLAEEILFRGLVLRAIEKRLGTVIGVIGSVALFTAIHPADGGYFSSGQVVLWAAIGALAIVLTMAAVITERLAASMIAHVIINALAALRALGHFDGLLDVPT